MKNLYDILGIDKKASPEEVKRAYFEMAKKYHPDSGDEAEVRKFYEVSETYQILSSKEERLAYDLSLKEGKIASELVSEVIYQEPSERQKREGDPAYSFRQKEMHRFRRGLFIKAVLRVIGFSVFTAAAGLLITFMAGGLWLAGLFVGLAFGLMWSLPKNFDIDSFVQKKNKQKIFYTLRLIIFILSIGYFLAILIFRLLK